MNVKRHIDTSKPWLYRQTDLLSYEQSARLGRLAAFADIDAFGFAHAYNQAEVHDYSLEFNHPAHYFMHGYRQAVFGFWMAM